MIIKKSKNEPKIRRKSTLDDPYLRQKFLRKFLRKHGRTPFPRTSGREDDPDKKEKLQEKESDIEYDEVAVYETILIRRLYEIVCANEQVATNRIFFEGQKNYIRMFKAMNLIEDLFVKHLLNLSRSCIRSVLERILEQCRGGILHHRNIFGALNDNSKGNLAQVSFNRQYFTDGVDSGTAEHQSFRGFKRYVQELNYRYGPSYPINLPRRYGRLNPDFLNLLTDAVIMLLLLASRSKDEHLNLSFDKLQSKPLENLGLQNCNSLLDICECWDNEYFKYFFSFKKFIQVFKRPRNAVKHRIFQLDEYRKFLTILQQSLNPYSETQRGWKGFTHQEIREILNILCENYPEDTYNNQLSGLQFIIPDYLRENPSLLPREGLLSVNEPDQKTLDLKKFKSSFNERFNFIINELLFGQVEALMEKPMKALMIDFPMLLHHYVSGMAQGFKLFSSTNDSLLSADQKSEARDNADRMKMNLLHQIFTETRFSGTDKKLNNFMADNFSNKKDVKLVDRGHIKWHKPQQLCYGMQGKVRDYALKGGDREIAVSYLYQYLSLINQIVLSEEEEYSEIGWEGRPWTPAMKRELANIAETAKAIWESNDVHLNSHLLHFNLDRGAVKEAVEELQQLVNTVRNSNDLHLPIQGDVVDEILKVFLKLGLRSAYNIHLKEFPKAQNTFRRFPVPDLWHREFSNIRIRALGNYDRDLMNLHNNHRTGIPVYKVYNRRTGIPVYNRHSTQPAILPPPNANFQSRSQIPPQPNNIRSAPPQDPIRKEIERLEKNIKLHIRWIAFEDKGFAERIQGNVDAFVVDGDLNLYYMSLPDGVKDKVKDRVKRYLLKIIEMAELKKKALKKQEPAKPKQSEGRNSRKRKMPTTSENDSRMKKMCYQLDKKIEKYEMRIRKLDQIISDIKNKH